MSITVSYELHQQDLQCCVCFEDMSAKTDSAAMRPAFKISTHLSSLLMVSFPLSFQTRNHRFAHFVEQELF